MGRLYLGNQYKEGTDLNWYRSPAVLFLTDHRHEAARVRGKRKAKDCYGILEMWGFFNCMGSSSFCESKPPLSEAIIRVFIAELLSLLQMRSPSLPLPPPRSLSYYHLMMAGAEIATVGHFEVQETLYTHGFYRVKRARNTITGEQCALKLVKKSKKLSSDLVNTLRPLLEKEYEMRRRLDHPNILPAKSLELNAVYSKQHREEVEVMYMETGLCPYKDFFALQAAAGGPLPEPLARHFFQQLIDAVSYCHRQKVVHWNLKPENLALDAGFNLQITDFGTGPEARWGDSSTPPEVLTGDVRSGPAVDVFCCGFILFFWTYFEPPFQRADLTNLYYRQMVSGSEKFWVRAKGHRRVSEGLKSLLAGMMADEPGQRLSLSEVKAHPWLLEAALSPEACKQHLSAMLDSYASSKSRLCKPPARLLISTPTSVYQAWTESSSSISDFASFDSTLTTPIPLYNTKLFKFSELFLTLPPDRILNYLEDVFLSLDVEIEDKRTAYKLKAKLITDTSKIRFVVKLMDCGDGKYCLDLTREEGEEFEFYLMFRNVGKYFEERMGELQD